MISSPASLVPATRALRVQLFRGLFLFAAIGALAGAAFAQTTPAPTPTPAPATGASPAATDNTNGNGRNRRGQNGGQGGNRGNFDPAQIQERMMANLREQFDVPDDTEWKTIADRITAVTELRRTAGGGFGGFAAFRGGQGGGGGGGRPGRGGAAANPEAEALRQAITDKLPDAEIKSRLSHLREVRKANEEKLSKAQEDLRGILSVRQEAVAVMAGLLP